MGWPEWLEEWQAWLGLAVLLGALELFSLDLILLMLAGGAVLGMVAAMVGLPVAAQVLIALAGSLAALALVRPSVVKRLHGGPTLVLGHDALVGKQGVVIEQVSVHGGQVKIGGDVWTARPYDEDLVIEPGATVDVFQIKGATALVHQVPELDP
jgi:membrane protein implicated in regulation of membrane protease activity